MNDHIWVESNPDSEGMSEGPKQQLQSRDPLRYQEASKRTTTKVSECRGEVES